jgi:DNA polymerase-1
MEAAVQGPDGHYYLFGNFNLGGTVSGRLSSSDPNLQTIPSGNEGEKTKKGRYGKLIKSCFVAPPGHVLIGLDFASLEDKISALTTKDRNKLKVYTDGFDGHSLRAQSYFGEDMPDIELAPEGARCFRAMIGTKEIFFHEQEQVSYAGQLMTGLELWERLENIRVVA